MSKWEVWYNSLPEHTKQFLDKQPVWYDRDLYKAIAIGILVGFAVGFIFGYDAASPDLSKQPITYLRG